MGVSSKERYSVANSALARPHMLRISIRDETYLKLNSVMTLRHSRKRDKIYLKKLSFMRNFLNLLQLYRAYLSWKFQKRSQRAIDWQQRSFRWNFDFYQSNIGTVVIFRYHQCQLTMTYVITSLSVLSFDIAPIDKIFHISFGRETLHSNLLIVDEILPIDCEKNFDFSI